MILDNVNYSNEYTVTHDIGIVLEIINQTHSVKLCLLLISTCILQLHGSLELACVAHLYFLFPFNRFSPPRVGQLSRENTETVTSYQQHGSLELACVTRRFALNSHQLFFRPLLGSTGPFHTLYLNDIIELQPWLLLW